VFFFAGVAEVSWGRAGCVIQFIYTRAHFNPSFIIVLCMHPDDGRRKVEKCF
jgi:hypothetical protein